MTAKPVVRPDSVAGVKSTPSRWVSIFSKGGFAILDQGLFAGTNFIVNVLLARWMSPEQYGAFAVAYSVFLLAGSFHSAVIIGPMMIFGAGKYSENFQRYLGFLLAGHGGFSLFIGALAAVTALVVQVLGDPILADALFGLMIAAPLILLLWVTRRAFYVHSRPQWAASGGALYLGLMLAGIYALFLIERLSAFSALVVMGGASLLVSLWLAFILRPAWPFSKDRSTLRMVLVDHWNYGKWSVSTVVLQWFSSNIYYTLLPAMIGLQGSAALRATLNLVMPILHANSAIAMLLVPSFVRVFRSNGMSGLQRRVRLGLALFTMSAAAYWVFLILFGPQVIDWLYDGRYNEYATRTTLFLLGALPLSAGMMAVLTGALNAMQRFSRIFWAYVFTSLVTLTLGMVFLATGGVAGAVAGLLASSMATVIASGWFFMRERVHEEKAQ